MHPTLPMLCLTVSLQSKCTTPSHRAPVQGWAGLDWPSTSLLSGLACDKPGFFQKKCNSSQLSVAKAMAFSSPTSVRPLGPWPAPWLSPLHPCKAPCMSIMKMNASLLGCRFCSMSWAVQAARPNADVHGNAPKCCEP